MHFWLSMHFLKGLSYCLICERPCKLLGLFLPLKLAAVLKAPPLALAFFSVGIDPPSGSILHFLWHKTHKKLCISDPLLNLKSMEYHSVKLQTICDNFFINLLVVCGASTRFEGTRPLLEYTV